MPPQPALPDVEALLRRRDGPLPAEEALSTLTGQPAGLLRLRSISREVDRLALEVARSIAGYREDLVRSRASRWKGDLAIGELSHRLAHYRKLGVRLDAEAEAEAEAERVFADRR